MFRVPDRINILKEIKIRHTTIKISKDYGEDDLGRLDCKRFHS